MATLFEKAEYLLTVKKIRRVIYRSEISSSSMGISPMEIIEKYSEETVDDKLLSRYLKKISKDLDRGRPKDIVYGEFLDDDINLLLSDSLKKKIPSNSIFEGYVPFKELGEKIQNSMKMRLFFPLFIYLAVTIALFFTLENFKEMSESGLVKFTPEAEFIMNNFLYINAAIGVVIAYFIILKPHTIPKIKDIFHKVNAMMALSTAKTMNEMRYGARDTINTLKRQFKIKEKRKKVVKHKNDTDALMHLLKEQKYLTVLQAAELKLNDERGKFKEGIDVLLLEIKDEVSDLRTMADEIVSKVGIILLVPPIAMMLMIIMELLNQGQKVG